MELLHSSTTQPDSVERREEEDELRLSPFALLAVDADFRIVCISDEAKRLLKFDGSSSTDIPTNLEPQLRRCVESQSSGEFNWSGSVLSVTQMTSAKIGEKPHHFFIIESLSVPSEEAGHFRCFGPLRLNLTVKSAFVHKRFVGLSPVQYDLLEALCLQEGRIVSKEELAKYVWGKRMLNERAPDIAISRLKASLRRAGISEECIQTVRGKGYLFDSTRVQF